MRPIPTLFTQTSKSIMECLDTFPLHYNESIGRQFRKLKCDDIHMTVMFYYCDRQIILVGIEQHPKPKDYLIDEEPFGEEAPLYFSECDHYVSPIYRLKQLRKAVMKALQTHHLSISVLPWIVLVTNSKLINKDTYDEDVWMPEHIFAFDKVDYPLHFRLPEEHKTGSEWAERIFNCADEYTECEPFKKADEVDEDELEEEFARMMKEFIEQEFEPCNDKEEEEQQEDTTDEMTEEVDEEVDEEVEDEVEETEVEGPFSEPKELPYVPELEDGLRAEVYPRIEHPENVLKELIGCDEIRQQIEQLTALHRYNLRLRDYNPKSEVHNVSMHAIFHGAPGTGKTTLCRLYASLLHKAGVLQHGHVVVASRATFVGNNFGDEEKAVYAVLHAAQGGVLMIDEAYQLNPPHPHDPGKNVLPLMMPQLADESARNMAIVLCGYTEPMENLLSQNEGLESRFPNRFKFPDFSVSQLLQISKLRIKKFGYHFTPKAWVLYKDVVTQRYNNRDKRNWGNAREVANLLERIYIYHAQRCNRQNVKNKKMLVITVADIKPLQLTSTPTKRSIGFK